MVEERGLAGDWTRRVPGRIQGSPGRERYYVLDGQLRLIRHWYHHISSVTVYIYRGKTGDVQAPVLFPFTVRDSANCLDRVILRSVTLQPGVFGGCDNLAGYLL
jgi:hypothetical protein